MLALGEPLPREWGAAKAWGLAGKLLLLEGEKVSACIWSELEFYVKQVRSAVKHSCETLSRVNETECYEDWSLGNESLKD